MALSEAGGIQVGSVTYGAAGRRRRVRPKKGPARGSPSVRTGKKGKQAFYVRPASRRRR